MELFCPECMGPLVSADGQTATCSIHGGTYKILFNRQPIPGPAQRVAPGAIPVGPPLTPVDDLSSLAAAASQTRGYPAVGDFSLGGVTCITHPSSPAVARCQTCRAAVCATCVFTFSGGVQLCPACASNPAPRVSSRRRKLGWWSVGLGAGSMVGLLGMFAAIWSSPHAEAEAIGTLFAYLSLVPALIGVALGFGSRDRRLPTPVSAWIGIALGGVTLLIWILLIIVGMMK